MAVAAHRGLGPQALTAGHFEARDDGDVAPLAVGHLRREGACCARRDLLDRHAVAFDLHRHRVDTCREVIGDQHPAGETDVAPQRQVDLAAVVGRHRRVVGRGRFRRRGGTGSGGLCRTRSGRRGGGRGRLRRDARKRHRRNPARKHGLQGVGDVEPSAGVGLGEERVLGVDSRQQRPLDRRHRGIRRRRQNEGRGPFGSKLHLAFGKDHAPRRGPSRDHVHGPGAGFGVAILDTTLVVTSRLAHRQSPFSGGRDHISHRLVFVGIPVRSAVALVYAAGIALGWLAIIMSRLDLITGSILIAFVIAVALFAGVMLGLIPVYEQSRRRRMMLMEVVPHEVESEPPKEQIAADAGGV